MDHPSALNLRALSRSSSLPPAHRRTAASPLKNLSAMAQSGLTSLDLRPPLLLSAAVVPLAPAAPPPIRRQRLLFLHGEVRGGV
jgi:hypothetical protein